MRKVRWGVLGVAGIAVRRVIPGMRQCELCEIIGIASRDRARAEHAAKNLGVARAYGSYEELLADPEIDVVYNPLPNHLHVPWTIKAAEAGKHVLCEKPLSMTAGEGEHLLAVRDRTGVKIGEAFMVATAPQWVRLREIVKSGEIGDLRAITGFFSYTNLDPANIRNVPDFGGGGLMDIGCYPIFTSRFVSDQEPRRVVATLERDPKLGTDRLTTAILDYPFGHAVFTCSTQISPHQFMKFIGTKGRVELEIPFNTLNDRTMRVSVDDGRDLIGTGRRVEEFGPVDQYTIQGDAFSKAVLGQGDVPVSLETALGNMRVIDAVFKSAGSGAWEKV
ncbi:MAG TPA: Gfo/Idh/MocA family oxidoreductase [Bryobacteraceae bacterium]|jgi:predicted dehydrogenase